MSSFQTLEWVYVFRSRHSKNLRRVLCSLDLILTYLYNPGSTVITRTPNFAISCLRPSENAIHAFLDMEYAANAGTVNLPIKRVKHQRMLCILILDIETTY